MKKVLLLALCLVFALTCAACGDKKQNGGDPAQDPMPEAESNTQLPNPFTDCATLEEAAEAAGFSVQVPESIQGYPTRSVQAVKGSMIQVLYADGEPGAEETASILIRKGKGSEDISGVYIDYNEEKTYEENGAEVTVKGENGKIFLALWQKEGFSYSVYAERGMDETVASALIRAVN